MNRPDESSENRLPKGIGDPFRAPEGYFASFPSRLMEQLPARRPAEARPAWRLALWLAPSLAVGMLLVMTLFTQPGGPAPGEDPWAALPDAEVQNYLLDGWSTTDDDLLASTLADADISLPASPFDASDTDYTPAALDTPRYPARGPAQAQRAQGPGAVTQPAPQDSAKLKLQHGLDELFQDNPNTQDLQQEIWYEVGNDDSVL